MDSSVTKLDSRLTSGAFTKGVRLKVPLQEGHTENLKLDVELAKSEKSRSETSTVFEVDLWLTMLSVMKGVRYAKIANSTSLG
ncbi:MAG: hypothetical protein Q9227_006482 [Pyrenula ochraceoflavens]